MSTLSTASVWDQLPQPHQVALPGSYQGVHFTFAAAHGDELMTKIERWFDDRDEITLVGYNTTSKRQDGFILLEWDGYEIDPWFLKFLREEESITDYSVYECREGASQ